MLSDDEIRKTMRVIDASGHTVAIREEWGITARRWNRVLEGEHVPYQIRFALFGTGDVLREEIATMITEPAKDQLVHFEANGSPPFIFTKEPEPVVGTRPLAQVSKFLSVKCGEFELEEEASGATIRVPYLVDLRDAEILQMWSVLDAYIKEKGL